MLQWQKSRSLIALNVTEDVEQQELSFAATGHAKWYSHYEDNLANCNKTKYSFTI